MDLNAHYLVTSRLLADHFEQVPTSESTQFPAVLIEIVQRYGVDTYLPLLPEEIEVAARMQLDGSIGSHVKVLAPPLFSARLCADKWELTQCLLKVSIPVPRTTLMSSASASGEVFIKPRRGSGSVGARRVSGSELSFVQNPESYIVQEICHPPEVTVDAFFQRFNGFGKAICRERLEVKAGVSTKCRVFIDDALSSLAGKLSDLLDLDGTFCFQVMSNEMGWVVTDVNPRPGAATAISVATGNDFFAAAFANAWGQDVSRFFCPLVREQFVTRQYSEFVMTS